MTKQKWIARNAAGVPILTIEAASETEALRLASQRHRGVVKVEAAGDRVVLNERHGKIISLQESGAGGRSSSRDLNREAREAIADSRRILAEIDARHPHLASPGAASRSAGAREAADDDQAELEALDEVLDELFSDLPENVRREAVRGRSAWRGPGGAPPADERPAGAGRSEADALAEAEAMLEEAFADVPDNLRRHMVRGRA